MKDKWDRTFDDICNDADVSYNNNLSWHDLLPLIREKWISIARCTDEDLLRMRTMLHTKYLLRQMFYLWDNDTCAFCRKASFISRANDYGINGETCLACILNGKCYHASWVIMPIIRAFVKNNWSDARRMIGEGYSFVNELVS